MPVICLVSLGVPGNQGVPGIPGIPFLSCRRPRASRPRVAPNRYLRGTGPGAATAAQTKAGQLPPAAAAAEHPRRGETKTTTPQPRRDPARPSKPPTRTHKAPPRGGARPKAPKRKGEALWAEFILTLAQGAIMMLGGRGARTDQRQPQQAAHRGRAGGGGPKQALYGPF